MTSMTEWFGFAAASLRLHLKMPGPFEEVAVVLCEDDRTVMLEAYSEAGEFAIASFELDEKISADEFDDTSYRQAFVTRACEVDGAIDD